MRKKGFFITLEGTDGVGKSTQAKLLASWLVKKGKKVTLTREPGGGRVAEKIRNVLLDPRLKVEKLTELFLYEAARVDHLHKVIRPALTEGKVVICDRFTDATVAYQGFARGLMKESILLNKIATEGITPDLTLLLNLPPNIGIRKALARGKKGRGDRMENEGLGFQRKVQKGYLSLQHRYPHRIKLIAVRETIEETQTLIRRTVGKKIK